MGWHFELLPQPFIFKTATAILCCPITLLFLYNSFQLLIQEFGFWLFVKTPHPNSCSLENDMDSGWQKTISCLGKRNDNQNSFCPALCYFSLTNRCRKSLPGKPSRARRRGRLTSEILSLQVGFSARHIVDTPKSVVVLQCYRSTFNLVEENMLI